MAEAPPVEDDDAEMSSDEEPEAASSDESDDIPARGFAAITDSGGDPSNENWRTGELLAYQEGPFADAFAFRGISYAYALIGGFFGYGWHVLAMFLLGAAFIKWDFFAAERRSWRGSEAGTT